MHRTSPSEIFLGEKRDKMVNWECPTPLVVGSAFKSQCLMCCSSLVRWCITSQHMYYLAPFLCVPEVLCFGKVGSARKGFKTDTHLAIGSIIRTRPIRRMEKRSLAVLVSDCTIGGDHITLGSVLHESRD